MARKRLSAPQEIYLGGPAAAMDAAVGTPAGLASPFAPSPAPPIAMIAGEASAQGALRDMAGALAAARAEGRLVQALPLAAVEADHLVRDRLSGDAEDMAALKDSLRARGQQHPIDVVALDGGRFGLISGWRRLTALRDLHAETGEARFAQVQALIRRPDSASDAYLAMVEENEIRANLSHYERARIAALAAEQGVFPSPQAALRALFANASRAKRSKIGSFMALHRELGSVLAFPAAISERLGLALAAALDGQAAADEVIERAPGPDFAETLRARLQAARPQSAEAEAKVLAAALAAAKKGSAQAESANAEPDSPPAPLKEIRLETHLIPEGLRITLTGSGVSHALAKKLATWLRRQD